MTTFEITVHDPDSSAAISFQIKARDWKAAMTEGLDELGEVIGADDAVVDVSDEEVIFVTVPHSGRQLVIKARDEGAEAPMDTTPIRKKTLEKVERLSTGVESPSDLQPTQAADVNKARELPATSLDRAQSPRLQIRSDPKAQTQRLRKKDLPGDLPEAPTRRPRTPEARPVRATTEQLVASVEACLDRLDLPRCNAEQIIDATMILMREQVPCEATQFLLPDQDTDHMRVVASRGLRAGDVVLTKMSVHARIASACAGDQVESLRVAGEDVAFVYHGRKDRTFTIHVNSAMAVPLVWQGRVLGVLLCINAPDGAGFTNGEHTAADVLADRVAAALQSQL